MNLALQLINSGEVDRQHALVSGLHSAYSESPILVQNCCRRIYEHGEFFYSGCTTELASNPFLEFLISSNSVELSDIERATILFRLAIPYHAENEREPVVNQATYQQGRDLLLKAVARTRSTSTLLSTFAELSDVLRVGNWLLYGARDADTAQKPLTARSVILNPEHQDASLPHGWSERGVTRDAISDVPGVDPGLERFAYVEMLRLLPVGSLSLSQFFPLLSVSPELVGAVIDEKYQVHWDIRQALVANLDWDPHPRRALYQWVTLEADHLLGFYSDPDDCKLLDQTLDERVAALQTLSTNEERLCLEELFSRPQALQSGERRQRILNRWSKLVRLEIGVDDGDSATFLPKLKPYLQVLKGCKKLLHLEGLNALACSVESQSDVTRALQNELKFKEEDFRSIHFGFLGAELILAHLQQEPKYRKAVLDFLLNSETEASSFPYVNDEEISHQHIRANFWWYPPDLQAAFVKELLFPVGSDSPHNIRAEMDDILEQAFPGAGTTEDNIRSIVSEYLNEDAKAFPLHFPYQVAALLIAARSSNNEGGLPTAVARFCEADPYLTKSAQKAQSFTGTDPDWKAAFRHLKHRSRLPSRSELLLQMIDNPRIVPPALRSVIQHVSNSVYGGAYRVVVRVRLYDGRDAALVILRPEVETQSITRAGIVESVLESHAHLGSPYNGLLEINRDAKTIIPQAVSIDRNMRQIDEARRLYHGLVVTDSTTNQNYTYAVPGILEPRGVSRETYLTGQSFLLEWAEGQVFIDYPRATPSERQHRANLAGMIHFVEDVVQLQDRIAGDDGHDGQCIINEEKRVIYRVDHEDLPLKDIDPAELEIVLDIATTALRSKAANNPEALFAATIAEANERRGAGRPVPTLLSHLERAILARSPYREAFVGYNGNNYYRDVLGSALVSAGPIWSQALCRKLTGSPQLQLLSFLPSQLLSWVIKNRWFSSIIDQQAAKAGIPAVEDILAGMRNPRYSLSRQN